MNISGRYINDKGVALISALLFMAIITIAGTSAYFASSNELLISSNYRSLKQSFYDAEAGVAYTLAVIEKDLILNNISLTGSTETLSSYSAPTGYFFTPVTTLIPVGTKRYRFQVTGIAGGATATLEIVFKRRSTLPCGLFGDSRLFINREIEVYSYDSAVTLNPVPLDSTREADIGSNGEVVVDLNTEIDGDVDLGNAVDFTEAAYTEIDTPIINGIVQDVNRVDPDPLGANGGDLENDFNTYQLSNDNSSVAGITGQSLNIASEVTVSLIGDSISEKNFYLTDVTVASGGTLNIDASAGPINIYLTGPLWADIGSHVFINGPPTNVTIFSNSTYFIAFAHKESFKGMIYAPYANIMMMNEADAFGVLWGNDTTVQNIGNFFCDTAILNNRLDYKVSVTSWKDMRYD